MERSEEIHEALSEAREYSVKDIHGEAFRCAEKAMILARQEYGEDHPDYAATVKAAASIYSADQRYDISGPLLQHALKIQEKALAPDNPDLVPTLLDLARLHRTQDRLAMAESLLTRALAIQEQAPEPVLPDADTIRHELTDVCRRLGQEHVPATLSDGTVAAKEAQDDAETLRAAMTLEAQAADHAERGRHDDAAALLARALSIKDDLHLKRGLDAEAGDKLAVYFEIPDTAASLAAQYHAVGRYEDAERLLKRALSMIEKVFDPDNVKFGKTAAAHDALGALYEAQGRYGDAERHFEKVVSVLEKFGFQSPNLSAALENLARVRIEQGRYDAVEPLLRRSLKMREEGLGRDHPSIGETLNKLAELYRAQGRPEKAGALGKRLETIRQREARSNGADPRGGATD